MAEFFTPAGIWPVPGYEHVARAGDFVFVAGQVARNSEGQLVGPGDAALQAAQVFHNIGLILEHLKAAPTDVVKITTILADRSDGAVVSDARRTFFGDHRPPHTGFVAELGSPEVRVEVEITLYLPRPGGA
jgi:2-iminobutanoate/2-iminopropanoate deaminase